LKALILAPFEESALARLGSRLGLICRSWTDTQALLEPADFLSYFNTQDVQIAVIEADFIFEEVFEATENLRFIGVCRSAVNNVDLESATQHGVVVVNTPARNSAAVAELTLGLALSLARKIPRADALVKSGGWRDPAGPYVSLRGSELGGKTAGLIGFGAIGREVARRFQAFGMNVLAFDPYVDESILRQHGVQPADLNTLLTNSDILSLHCSAGPETHGLVGPAELQKLKPSAYLINTASWEAIDEKALLEALANHRLAGAAFDIFCTHPLPSQSPLLSLDNVILTPHLGGATAETIARYSRMIADDILRFLDGQRPLNLLNPEVWRSHVA
jgi:D-3-phosphoglycerate dehydrogenase